MSREKQIGELLYWRGALAQGSPGDLVPDRAWLEQLHEWDLWRLWYETKQYIDTISIVMVCAVCRERNDVLVTIKPPSARLSYLALLVSTGDGAILGTCGRHSLADVHRALHPEAPQYLHRKPALNKVAA